MKPFYAVYLYLGVGAQTCIATHEDEEESRVEHLCLKLHRQLRAMDAKGEVRVLYFWRENFRFLEKDVAVVKLSEEVFNYERIDGEPRTV